MTVILGNATGVGSDLQAIVRALPTLGEFFGALEVDDLNRRVAIYADCPEWLRGICRESAMPRRFMGSDLPHRFVVPATDGERALLIDWIVENLSGAWNINNRWISFETDMDAVAYRLKTG
jgi:hypothetical protein